MGKGLCNTHRRTGFAAAPFAPEPVNAAAPRAEPAGSGKRRERFSAPVKLACLQELLIPGHFSLLFKMRSFYQSRRRASIRGRAQSTKNYPIISCLRYWKTGTGGVPDYFDFGGCLSCSPPFLNPPSSRMIRAGSGNGKHDRSDILFHSFRS